MTQQEGLCPCGGDPVLLLVPCETGEAYYFKCPDCGLEGAAAYHIQDAWGEWECAVQEKVEASK